MTTKTVLITGGAGGIGREFSKLFIQDGYQLVVFSLLQQELDDLGAQLKEINPSATYTSVQMDLSQVNAAEQVFAWCEENNVKVDVLVNNVGFGLLGEHVEMDITRLEKMLLLNNMLMTKMCRLFGKQMKDRGEGHILNVASLVSFAPAPLFGAYGGSKSFVLDFTVCLARELQDYGVKVTCLCPGTTKTAFLDTAQVEHKSSSAMTKFVSAYMVTPDIVAKAGYDALFKGKIIALPNFFLRFQASFMGCLPKSLVSWFVYKKTK